ncbi:hypothetical protein [Anaerosporobacter sp.]
MIYILGNQFFKSAMKIDEVVPEVVSEAINKTLYIYENNYNCNSIPFQSGGYCSVIISHDKKLYHDFLNMYNISPGLAEFREIICEQEDCCWYQEYYQLSTEYGISVFFYEQKGVSV